MTCDPVTVINMWFCSSISWRHSRYVREWLFSMVAAKIVFATDDDKYYIPETCKGKTGKSHYSTILPAVAPLTKDLEKCFKANEDYTAGNAN